MDFKIKKILMFIGLAGILYSCNFDNPLVSPQTKLLKTQTKWLLDESNAKIRVIQVREFNKSGELIKNQEFSESGSGLISEVTISYLKNCKFEEIRDFSKDSTPVIRLNTYLLDQKGNVTQKITTDHSGDTLSVINYNYDGKGNLLDLTNLDKSGNIISHTSYDYKYNKDGFVIGTSTLNSGLGGTTTSRDTIVYNTETRQVDRTIFNDNGFASGTYTYLFDKDGRIVKEFHSNSTGAIIKRYEYLYTYY